MEKWEGTARRMLMVSRVVLLVVALMSLSSLGTYVYCGWRFRVLRPSEMAATKSYEELMHVWRVINEDYVESPEKEALVRGAIRGMVEELGDPYSSYMDPSRYKEAKLHTSGKYVGVGIAVEQVGEYVTVVAPFKGTPAYEAGIVSGDRITKVDGQDVVGSPVERAVALIKGPAGTFVRLGILSKDGQFREVTLARTLITPPTVEGRMIDADIGYLRITQFASNTAEEMRGVLKELKSQGMKAMVLDLRHNPGGLFDQALEVAEMLVPQGPVVKLVSRGGEQRSFDSDSSGAGFPLVALVDKGSASAAEIVAGAIQDRGVGPLVGTKTFGKASVQSLVDLPNGSGLRITTARYLTPNGTLIDRKGLEPDVVVEEGDRPGESPEGAGTEQDRQLMAAVQFLKGRLSEE